MTLTNRIFRNISILLAVMLLTVSLDSSVPIQAQGQIGVDEGMDWTHVNYDVFASNFNPQRKINSDNIGEMQIKWVFPIPRPEEPRLGGYNIRGQGEVSTPLIINGKVYFSTSSGRVYALDAEHGDILWVHTLQLDRQMDEKKELPIFIGKGITHVHGITYFEKKLYVPAPPCDIYIINVDDGVLVNRIEDMCDVGPDEGNSGKYKGPQSYGPTIYRMGRVIIASGGSVDETNRGGRGFFSGYDLDSGELLWRFFVTPPAGGDPEWAIRHAEIGWIRGIRASTLPRESLLEDWGLAGEMGSQAGPNRGQWTIDDETGIVYVGTTHAAPASNGTNRPGPNVFAASVLALQAKTGELLWWHQLVPHDLSDWDCNWNIVLGRTKIAGVEKKVIYKGCKEGSMNALDADNGEVLWSFTPETIKICEICHLLDPMNPESLRKPWVNFPQKDPFFRNPTGRGGLVSDVALAYGKVFYGTYNFWDYVKVTAVTKHRPGSEGAISVPAQEFRESNTTIYALDASSGEVIWSYLLHNTGYRTGLVATGGLILFTSVDGNIRALDVESGDEIWKKQFGVGLLMPPSIGADTNGDMMVVQVYGGQTTPELRTISSAVVALHLPPDNNENQKGLAPMQFQSPVLVIGAITAAWIPFRLMRI